MPRKKPAVFTRTVTVGPCVITVEAKGNPLTWTGEERQQVDRVLDSLDLLTPKLPGADTAAS